MFPFCVLQSQNKTRILFFAQNWTITLFMKTKTLKMFRAQKVTQLRILADLLMHGTFNVPP